MDLEGLHYTKFNVIVSANEEGIVSTLLLRVIIEDALNSITDADHRPVEVVTIIAFCIHVNVNRYKRLECWNVGNIFLSKVIL